jgi:hypothetical protein
MLFIRDNEGVEVCDLRRSLTCGYEDDVLSGPDSLTYGYLIRVFPCNPRLKNNMSPL